MRTSVPVRIPVQFPDQLQWPVAGAPDFRLSLSAENNMKMEIIKEIIFRTARSGGKGGQNVNKVETMVEGWPAESAPTFTTFVPGN